MHREGIPEARVRSCVSSALIRCTPILIWSFSKESAKWSIIIREKPDLAQNYERELCMPQKQRNLSFWFIQTISQNFSNISYILKNGLNRVVTMQDTVLFGPVPEEAESSSFMMDINLLITLLFCVLGTPDMLFYSCFFR